MVEFDAGKVAFGNSDIHISGLTEPISRVPFFFARSNLFCQVGGGALRQLGNVADCHRSSTHRCAAKRCLDYASCARSWTIFVQGSCDRPTLFSLLFTDGAYEDGAGPIGAAVFDDKKGIAAFGFSVDEHLLKFWKRRGEKQPIGLLEILPVRVAKMVFADASPCGFIDSEGARAILINGYSSDIGTGNMLSTSARFDTELGCLPWWARAPSAGNPARALQTGLFCTVQIWPSHRDSFHLTRMRFALNEETAWTQWSHTRTHPRPVLRILEGPERFVIIKSMESLVLKPLLRTLNRR